MRTLVVWCPDWPVMAALADLPVGAAVAVLESGGGAGLGAAKGTGGGAGLGAAKGTGKVLACSPGARAEGVRRGMRRRDAQACCPDLVVVEHRAEVDARAFEEVLVAIEELSPGVAPLRPGLCALRVPSRFYGGEAEAAAVIAERLVALGVWDVRLGLADTLFAAEQAARRALTQDCLVVPEGQARSFLADLPVEVLDDPDLVDLLRRLGLTTVADFAALGAADVLTRFGRHGALLHRLARGEDPHPVGRRAVPPELQAQVVFEPPLETVEPIAFSVRTTAEQFVAKLADVGLVCTGVRLEADVNGVVASSRTWLHPRWFTATDLVDRVRWQLESATGPGAWGRAGEGHAGIDAVRFLPEVTEPLSEHADPLFGPRPDDRVERVVARVQGMLGHEGVVAVQAQGGRSPAARQVATPWGEQGLPVRSVSAPWPGAVPPPAPATVYPEPRSASVVGAQGQAVGVDDRGAVSCEPARVRADDSQAWQPVSSWAGPWPVDEQWWDEATSRRVARFQVVGVDGTAWLMVVENGQWWTEARYD
ncbi:DNA polymerase Y family protein [Aeromicrobium sp. CTD01-1L150]|uniref:DNA polymerase Y family protein n=1 Tax=Aeromicrobium sp. CTD01-1L150 TaxID=3341830 RepID=UPI0035BFFEE0